VEIIKRANEVNTRFQQIGLSFTAGGGGRMMVGMGKPGAALAGKAAKRTSFPLIRLEIFSIHAAGRAGGKLARAKQKITSPPIAGGRLKGMPYGTSNTIDHRAGFGDSHRSGHLAGGPRRQRPAAH
jgi:hypothetical protein